jgi:hypothetical protein
MKELGNREMLKVLRKEDDLMVHSPEEIGKDRTKSTDGGFGLGK